MCYPEIAGTALQALQEAAPDVDARTAVTLWDGRACDYGMVIESLLRRDGMFP